MIRYIAMSLTFIFFGLGLTPTKVSAQTYAVRINCGGPEEGLFSSDINYSGGNVFSTGNLVAINGVINAAPNKVYQSVRWGNFKYLISGLVSGRNYTIRLHFSDFVSTGIGQRVFHLNINSTPVLYNFDIFQEAQGSNIAVVREFSASANSQGQIHIQPLKGIGEPVLSGIEILNLNLKTSDLTVGTNTTSGKITVNGSAGNEGDVLKIVNGVPTWVNPGSLSDRDGNKYTTVVIGQQEWTIENWKSTKYNDGTPIPNITNISAWWSLDSPAYAFYNNDSKNKNPWGALYNWYVVSPSNPKKLAPLGWRVPTDADWKKLENYLHTNGYASGPSTDPKEAIGASLAAQTLWGTVGVPGTLGYEPEKNNASGFSAFPAGIRSSIGDQDQGSVTIWWTSLEQDLEFARNWRILETGDFRSSGNGKKFGFSVRLVRDIN